MTWEHIGSVLFVIIFLNALVAWSACCIAKRIDSDE